MKLSVWQQFSSNHSAWFTVVGKFKTPDEAQKAGDEMMATLRAVQDWWDALEEDELIDWLSRVQKKELTPVEQSLAKQHGIEWSFPVEWHDPDGITKKIRRSMSLETSFSSTRRTATSVRFRSPLMCLCASGAVRWQSVR